MRGRGIRDFLKELGGMLQADIAREAWDIHHKFHVIDLAKMLHMRLDLAGKEVWDG